MKNVQPQTLVLGGTGKTGRRVAQMLIDKGYEPRIASRSTGVKFNWEEESTWTQVLRNIDQVYISFQPDLAMPGAVKTIRAFTEFAAHHRVSKLVLLSGRGEPETQECEQVIIDSGLDYTIIRASWFFQNFSEGNFLEPILSGHLALPVGEVGEPFIDAEDIAEIAVAALTEEGHERKVYEVTGPRLLSFKDAVGEISKATGKPIRYEQVPIGAYADTLTSYQVPDEIVSLITYLFTEVLDGRNENLSNGVEQALGRKPRDFAEFAQRTAATGVWG